MELGLSLGDATLSKSSDGFITTTATATSVTTAAASTTEGVDKSLGFCMALGMNPLNGTTHQHTEKSHDDVLEEDDEQILKDNQGGMIKDATVSSQRIFSMNPPPVQLDLLPSTPVPRHTSFPWSSDNNGSSEGGSSGRGLDGRRVTTTEEATSSFRLEFMSYGSERGFEIGNDTVVVERGSSRVISDEDEPGASRKKLRLSKEQSAYLEESFKEHSTLNPKQKLALAKQLNLRPRQVEVWFQNRRARTKLKQTEVDFEYLKRCCETLTDENKRLRKELQELRTLKTTSYPFYMQLPATTLTMCPSCERVATTSATILPPSSTNLTKAVEQNSPKPTSLIVPLSHAPPSTNTHHQPAAS
ncbi:hypothetical protein SSX86_023022 [Deinandra increscens subsp. villosa]|uniref:Homeobox domain-containing protein n=1 Tax=Deinandra increscens subsp. villosa TaxID=3103831 RepID=A0AAP0GRQ1_9ASTR